MRFPGSFPDACNTRQDTAESRSLELHMAGEKSYLNHFLLSPRVHTARELELGRDPKCECRGQTMPKASPSMNFKITTQKDAVRVQSFYRGSQNWWLHKMQQLAKCGFSNIQWSLKLQALISSDAEREPQGRRRQQPQ